MVRTTTSWTLQRDDDCSRHWLNLYNCTFPNKLHYVFPIIVLLAVALDRFIPKYNHTKKATRTHSHQNVNLDKKHNGFSTNCLVQIFRTVMDNFNINVYTPIRLWYYMVFHIQSITSCQHEKCLHRLERKECTQLYFKQKCNQ